MNAKEIVRAWQEANPRVDHNLTQGSPGWHAFRATKFGASDAAAMLGISPYQTRNELLRQKFTGTGKEVSADLQRVFDKGHEAEALARPIVERLIDAELYARCVSCRESQESVSSQEQHAWSSWRFMERAATQVDGPHNRERQVSPLRISLRQGRRSSSTPPSRSPLWFFQ